jgi:hypothetical protein
MPTPSALCSTCKAVLGILDRESSLPVEDQKTEEHHPTFQSFRDAVQEGCFICATIWKTVVSENTEFVLLSDFNTRTPSFYKFYTSGSVDVLVSLDTYYSDTGVGLFQHVGFHIFPFRGSLFPFQIGPLLASCEDVTLVQSVPISVRQFYRF